jgi:hypothetical protein
VVVHGDAERPGDVDDGLGHLDVGLRAGQTINVACFVAGGIAAAFPECIGENDEDGSGDDILVPDRISRS